MVLSIFFDFCMSTGRGDTRKPMTRFIILRPLDGGTGELWSASRVYTIIIILLRVNRESTGAISEQDSLFFRRQEHEHFVYYRGFHSNGFGRDFDEKKPIALTS